MIAAIGQSLTHVAGDGLVGLLAILIPVSLLLVGIAMSGFAWAARSGQFENLDVGAARILFEAHRRPDRDDEGELTRTIVREHKDDPRQCADRNSNAD